MPVWTMGIPGFWDDRYCYYVCQCGRFVCHPCAAESRGHRRSTDNILLLLLLILLLPPQTHIRARIRLPPHHWITNLMMTPKRNTYVRPGGVGGVRVRWSRYDGRRRRMMNDEQRAIPYRYTAGFDIASGSKKEEITSKWQQ